MSFPPEMPQGALDWAGTPVPSPEEVAESLRAQQKPTMAQAYDLTEADFWRHRHVPAGSVLTFSAGFIEESAAGECAVLVKEREEHGDSIWLKVRCLGTEDKEFHAAFLQFFKRGKTQIHLCYGPIADCPESAEEGCHIDKFMWYPPGDFNAAWLSSAARKAVKDGPKLAADDPKAAGGGTPPRSAFTKLEDRLRRLKASQRVTFGGVTEDRKEDKAAGEPVTSRVGTGLRRRPCDSRLNALMDGKVKTEPIPVESDSEAPRRKRSSSSKNVEDRLAKAVTERLHKEGKREKKRSRSRSRRRRSKTRRRKRRRSDSRSSSRRSPSEKTESSSESLIPPLKKKAQRDPGSVFRLLELQAMEQLARDGVMEEDYMTSSTEGGRPKIFTFFQLAIKPGLDSKSRDCREISLLARCLDMLREGRLANLADTLAARLLAVETATRQGWATARHLEVFGPEEEGPVPPHILLSAQRHQRQVEKAGGKGSWPKQNQWNWPEWQGDSRPKGKVKGGKGKGKKGAGKNKGKNKGDTNAGNEGKAKEDT